MLDDVITAGTAIRGACDKIEAAGGQLVGVVELLDRQERGATEGTKTSAVQDIEKERGVPVVAVMTLRDIIDFAKQRPEVGQYLPQLEECECCVMDVLTHVDRAKYGVV